MRAHYLQHVPFEGLGIIEPWLRAEGYDITATRFYESTILPDWREVDLLVVMGGPMSVNDEFEFPWLVDEKQFIRSCAEREKSVLGICLGAQLIASSMGARVYPNPETEIGWFAVEGVPAPDGRVFRFPPSQDVFHWHGETFDLPAGAFHLARSAGCENQAFQIGRTIIGIQFHLESTPESVTEIVSNCRAELIPSTYVQSEQAILAAAKDKCQAINKLMSDLLFFMKNTEV